MLPRLLKRIASKLLCGAALIGVAHVAAAQEYPLPPSAPSQEPAPQEDLKARLDRLEKQNLVLQQALQALQAQQASQPRLGTPVAAEAEPGLNRDQVTGIVADYLKAQADKKVASGDKKSEWYEVGSDTKFSATWNNGIRFETANKDFWVHVGGRFQFDSYLYGEPESFTKSAAIGPIDDAMFMRRIRIEMYGGAFEQVEYAFEVDLETNQIGNGKSGSSTASAFDELWVGLKELPVIGNIRIGHIRPPQGLETYTSSRNLMFLERSSGFDCFAQEFDPGVWMFNNYCDGRLGWAFAFHRIEPDADVIQIGKGDYAGTGKIYGLPYYANNGRGLVHLGASYQYRSNAFDNALKTRDVQFRARPDFREAGITPRFVDTGLINADHVTTAALEALLIWGPFSVQAEYWNTMVPDATYPALKGKSVSTPTFTSGYVCASYFLTGENRAYDKRLGRIDRLKPNENFFCVRDEHGCRLSGCGTWEVAARYDMIDLTDKGINGGYMNNYTLGLNWYLNQNLKVQWNWNVADRTVPLTNVGGAASGPSGAVNSFGMRVQWEF